MANLSGVDGGLRELALFAGAGGGILGGHLLGWRTVCAVERDAYCAAVLASRQNDGCLPPFPIWSDVETFCGRPWRGLVDVVSGGFPCQDISCAGKGAGIGGARSGLWRHMRRIISEVRPRYAFVENSPMLTVRGLGRVLGDLATLGYDAEWGVVSAADTGAPHLRERIWILADANRFTWHEGRASDSKEGPGRRHVDRGGIDAPLAHAEGERRREAGELRHDQSTEWISEREQGIVSCVFGSKVWKESGERPNRSRGNGFGRWPAEPGICRVVDGMAYRVDRIKAIGNGQVPAAAALAWKLLSGRKDEMMK